MLCNFFNYAILKMQCAAIKIAFTKSSISAINTCLISPKKAKQFTFISKQKLRLEMNTYKTLSHVQIKVYYLNFDIYFKFSVGPQFKLSCVSVGISV